MQIGSKMGWLCLARTLGRLGLRLRKSGNEGNTSRRVEPPLDFTPSEAHNSARPFIPQIPRPCSHNEPYRDIKRKVPPPKVWRSDLAVGPGLRTTGPIVTPIAPHRTPEEQEIVERF